MQRSTSVSTFPVLPTNEIIDSCRMYHCNLVTLEVLQYPTAAKAQGVYEW